MKDHEIHLDNTEVKRGGDTLMDNEKRQWHWVGGPNKIKKNVPERILESISSETGLLTRE